MKEAVRVCCSSCGGESISTAAGSNAMRIQKNTQFIGTSALIVDLIEEIERVARSDAKGLITGESGAGKELVAQAIHSPSPRGQRPLIALNCAPCPEPPLECAP